MVSYISSLHSVSLLALFYVPFWIPLFCYLLYLFFPVWALLSQFQHPKHPAGGSRSSHAERQNNIFKSIHKLSHFSMLIGWKLRIHRIAVYFYGFLQWFLCNAFLTKVTSVISDVGTSGLSSSLQRAFHMALLVIFSKHIGDDTPSHTHQILLKSLYGSLLVSRWNKTKTPLNVTSTLWPFIQLLSHVVPLCCSHTGPFLGSLYLPPQTQSRAFVCASLDNCFHSSSPGHFNLFPSTASLGNILLSCRSNPPCVSLW